jgi:ribonuclease HIII
VLDEWGVRVADHREIDYATQYRLEHGAESVRLNVYTTGKVVAQGPSSGLKDLLDGRLAARKGADAREARPGSRPAFDGTPRVGIDEAGKGDYFGPLVVAGVRIAGKREAEELQNLGVRDSKTLDAEIMGELTDGVELIVVDQYAASARERLQPFVPEGVRLEVRQRAEDDAAVAAASVLARARQLEEMDKLSERVGFALPRGSSEVIEAGRRVVREAGEEGLEVVAKTSFGLTSQVLER